MTVPRRPQAGRRGQCAPRQEAYRAACAPGAASTPPADDDLAGLRDQALLLVGFAGALWRAELAAIGVEHQTTERGLRLTLPRSPGRARRPLGAVAISTETRFSARRTPSAAGRRSASPKARCSHESGRRPIRRQSCECPLPPLRCHPLSSALRRSGPQRCSRRWPSNRPPLWSCDPSPESNEAPHTEARIPRRSCGPKAGDGTFQRCVAEAVVQLLKETAMDRRSTSGRTVRAALHPSCGKAATSHHSSQRARPLELAARGPPRLQRAAVVTSLGTSTKGSVYRV